jgi:hypothetical protein
MIRDRSYLTKDRCCHDWGVQLLLSLSVLSMIVQREGDGKAETLKKEFSRGCLHKAQQIRLNNLDEG